jgi:hypothetical protein
MGFIILVAIIALSLAIVSGAFSIIGLASTFPSIFWPVIAMGVVLEAGKLAAASLVYRYWEKFTKVVTIPLIFCVTILTTITISGHFGYLSKGYLVDSISVKQVETKIQAYEDERQRDITRKNEIDIQIAQLPTDKVEGRIRLISQFKEEQKIVTTKVHELDDKITELKVTQIENTSHVGPIAYIAKALGMSMDDGVKWMILMITAVFDPIAMLLTISVSMMLRIRSEEQAVEKVEAKPLKKKTKIIEQGPTLEKFITKEPPWKSDTVTKTEQPVDTESEEFKMYVKTPFKH